MNEHIEITDTKENAVHKRSPEKIIAVIGAAVLLVKALLCAFLLWSGAYIRYVERYDFYPRNMNWGMSMQEVLKRENVEFNTLERDWGILLESKENVEFCGCEAKLVYVFVQDELMSGLFYIYIMIILMRRSRRRSVLHSICGGIITITWKMWAVPIMICHIMMSKKREWDSVVIPS